MIPSIRRFLLFNLLLSITITSSLTAVGNYFLDTADIKQHVDIHLKQTTEFLNMILMNTRYSRAQLKKIQHLMSQEPTKQKIQKLTPDTANKKTNDQFQFQVWNKQGQLILHSDNAEKHKNLTNNKTGFSDIVIKNQSWRAYSKYDPNLKITMTVAERKTFIQALEQRITLDNLLIILWTYPLLGLLIWLTVGQGLSSLKMLARKLANRAATDFTPMRLKNTPIEIKPILEELNQLFLRLQYEFERNKRFSSDAAHELRTPLAALKTQTQVAQLAKTEEERQAACQNVLIGVDRCTHIVEQLLALARLGQEVNSGTLHKVNIVNIAAETLAQLAPLALEKNIDLSLHKTKKSILLKSNEATISILIRNLVDNAIRYTPKDGHVNVEIEQKNNKAILCVTDSGPGIPPKTRKRVFERFYRIVGTKESGSGLGLAIVKQIADMHHAKIKLDTPQSGTGLKIEIIFPAD